MIKFRIKDNKDLFKKINLIKAFFNERFFIDNNFKIKHNLEKFKILSFYNGSSVVYSYIKKSNKNYYLYIDIDLFHSLDYLKEKLENDLKKYVNDNLRKDFLIFYNSLEVVFNFIPAFYNFKINKKSLNDNHIIYEKIKKLFDIVDDKLKDKNYIIDKIKIKINHRLNAKLTISYNYGQSFVFEKDLNYLPLLDLINIKKEVNKYVLAYM